MNTRSVVVTLTLIVFAGVWLLALWIGTDLACTTYYTTPDAANFQRFATPMHVGNESKFFYLFGPSIVLFVTGALSLSIPTRWLDRHWLFQIRVLNTLVARTMMLGLVSVLFLLIVRQHTHYALQATVSSKWHGATLRDPLVDGLCRIF